MRKMNLEDYEKWLEKHANFEEREAVRVVETILDYHQKVNKEYEFVQLFPRVKFKGMEFDLIILLSDKKKSLKETDFFDRVIGVEFKEVDTKCVVQQAVERRKYVDYQYVATRNVWMDYAEIFLMALFGIGWVVYEKGFSKLIIPSRMRDTFGKVEELVNYLIEKRMEKLVEDVVNRKLSDFLKR
ncbi:MAG TPA: hypothetical protein ENG66_06400 [Thermococcus sp.]|nr:hypothetical protein [Thermococcus sp.]